MDRAKRIRQMEQALRWYAEASTLDTLKCEFDVNVDSVSKTFVDDWRRFQRCFEDISHIYITGSDTERKAIDDIIEKIDKEYKR